jgi:hypothetical protein
MKKDNGSTFKIIVIDVTVIGEWIPSMWDVKMSS